MACRFDGSRMPGSEVSLLDAASKNNVVVVRKLLDGGADVDARDADGRTALHVAAMHDHLESVEMLLAAGAKADATDRFGDAPLHFAASHPSRLAVLERLLAAAPHAVHQPGTGEVGRFPLHVAVDAKWPDGIARLLACGADPRKPDAFGRSALDVAPTAKIRALLEKSLSTGSRGE